MLNKTNNMITYYCGAELNARIGKDEIQIIVGLVENQ